MLRTLVTEDPTAAHPRRLVASLCAILATTALAGCGAATQSPAKHDDRLKKAAGVSSIRIVCTRDLWEKTRPDDLNKVKATKLEGDRGDRGLVAINLNGTQLVSYLRELDEDAHAGWLIGDEDRDGNEPLARRMYDALAPTVDRIKPARGEGDPAPEVLVDDTVATPGP